jgi:hypothetical protein
MTPPNPEKMEPNKVEEDQDMELKPVVFGPGSYGSPDPATTGLSLNDAITEQAAEDSKTKVASGKESAKEGEENDDDEDADKEPDKESKPAQGRVQARGKQ